MAGCTINETTHTVVSAPTIISRDSLRRSVEVVAARPIVRSGKLLAAKHTLFVNKPYEGWHIVDNSTPSSARNVRFISAPGSLDGIVIGNYLYLQNSDNLVVLDITNETNPILTRRVEGILPVPAAPYSPLSYSGPEQAIVGWHDTIITSSFSYSPGY